MKVIWFVDVVSVVFSFRIFCTTGTLLFLAAATATPPARKSTPRLSNRWPAAGFVFCLKMASSFILRLRWIITKKKKGSLSLPKNGNVGRAFIRLLKSNNRSFIYLQLSSNYPPGHRLGPGLSHGGRGGTPRLEACYMRHGLRESRSAPAINPVVIACARQLTHQRPKCAALGVQRRHLALDPADGS